MSFLDVSACVRMIMPMMMGMMCRAVALAASGREVTP